MTAGSLERALVGNGHGRFVDRALPVIAIDHPVRWELHIAGGRYWLGTDDGVRQDFGDVTLTQGVLATRSIASVNYADGVRVPIALGSNVGTSLHRFVVDGDRLSLGLIATEIPDTDGIPDVVFRQLLLDRIVYRWAGRVDPLRPGGHRGTRLSGVSATTSDAAWRSR